MGRGSKISTSVLLRELERRMGGVSSAAPSFSLYSCKLMYVSSSR